MVMAGEGPCRLRLERVTRENSDLVRLVGFRPDVRPVLAAADMFVQTSAREGLPYALLEAMAMGLPAVVLDDPGSVEAVGDAGDVVPAGASGPLIDALAALGQDTGRRRELGTRARERVASRYLVTRMVERTKAVYVAALEE